MGVAHQVPAEAWDVALETRGGREAQLLNLVERERGGEAERSVGASGALLDRLDDGQGGERGAGVAFELWGRLCGWAPITERLRELRVITELVDVLRRILRRQDARADDAVMGVERDENITGALVTEDLLGLRLRREQEADLVLIFIADNEGGLWARLEGHRFGEERLRVRQRELCEGGVGRGRGQLQ